MTDQSATDARPGPTTGGAGEAPQVGRVYTVTIDSEMENQWTGPLGLAAIGDHFLSFPKAKVGQTFTVKVTSLAMNPYANRMEAKYERVADEPAAGGAAAKNPEVGRTYRVTVEKVVDKPTVGVLGLAYMGEYYFKFPKTKVGDTFTVTVTALRMNERSGKLEALYDVVDGAPS